MKKGYRQGRLGEEIKRITSDMIMRELKDPRLAGMISITAVDVSADSGYATCFVSVFESGLEGEALQERQTEVLSALDASKGLIRRVVGQQMKLKHTPELSFKIDRSMEYGKHMDELIAKVMKDQDG